MKKLIVGILLAMLVSGCSGSLINIDGVVDDTEAALIQVAIGAVLTSNAEYIAPAYLVSGVLRDYVDGESVVLSAIQVKVEELTEDSGLTAAERASASEVYALISAGLKAKFVELGVEDTATKLVVIDKVIEAVYTSAEARL